MFIGLSIYHIDCFSLQAAYPQTSNIKRIFVDNTLFDHPDVVAASPLGAAPTTSSLST